MYAGLGWFELLKVCHCDSGVDHPDGSHYFYTANTVPNARPCCNATLQCAIVLYCQHATLLACCTIILIEGHTVKLQTQPVSDSFYEEKSVTPDDPHCYLTGSQTDLWHVTMQRVRFIASILPVSL